MCCVRKVSFVGGGGFGWVCVNGLMVGGGLGLGLSDLEEWDFDSWGWWLGRDFWGRRC